MRSCWHENTTERPNFQTIIDELEALRRDVKAGIHVNCNFFSIFFLGVSVDADNSEQSLSHTTDSYSSYSSSESQSEH